MITITKQFNISFLRVISCGTLNWVVSCLIHYLSKIVSSFNIEQEVWRHGGMKKLKNMSNKQVLSDFVENAKDSKVLKHQILCWINTHQFHHVMCLCCSSCHVRMLKPSHASSSNLSCLVYIFKWSIKHNVNEAPTNLEKYFCISIRGRHAESRFIGKFKALYILGLKFC